MGGSRTFSFLCGAKTSGVDNNKICDNAACSHCSQVLPNTDVIGKDAMRGGYLTLRKKTASKKRSKRCVRRHDYVVNYTEKHM